MATTAITTPITNSPLQQFNSLSQLHIVRQVGFMIVVAAGIALSTAIVLWSTGSSYTAIYLDMSPQDTAEVVTILEQNAIDFEIENGTGTVTVASDQLQQTRLLLATNGLPRSSNRGYDVLEDEVNLGTSNFIEQARYNRALEEELVQTIKQIRGVREARVHISVPKQTSFIRNSSKPSASVMLDLINTQSMGYNQLAGIAHLVASSVAGLESEDVSIVDQRGKLLSQDGNSEFGDSNDNLRFTRNMEDEYNQRIIQLLTPIVGIGNVHTQVSADLDFTYIETTEETFDPATAAVRSEQTQEEVSGSNSAGNTIEPGTLSPNPPIENLGPAIDQIVEETSNRSRTNATRNFELDRTINHIRNVPGTINRLSVAVLVDLHPPAPVIPLPPVDPDADPEAQPVPPPAPVEEVINPALDQAKLDRLTQLVQDAVGFDPARGDSVNVINESFFHAPEIIPIIEIPIWQQEWVMPAAKQVAAGLVVLYLIFGVLRPAMKSVVSTQSSLPSRGSAQALTDESNPQSTEEQMSLASDGNIGRQPGKSVYDENLNAAQTLVQNEPARAARMIKDWVADD